MTLLAKAQNMFKAIYILVSAAYYTANNDLIFGITIDCKKGKWVSQITHNVTEKVTKHLTGDLTNPCKEGDIFDIWLKIHQPRMMSWIFNGQPLQYDTRTTYFRHGKTKIERTRPLKIWTKYGSDKGDHFTVKASGAAKFTRLSWGQCITWPRSLQQNCQQARTWVESRSKMAVPEGGLGHFGSDWNTFAPQCFLGSRYYLWLQNFLHPDRNSKGFPWCCCVDMTTGEVANGDVENLCSLGSINGACSRSCMEYADKDVIEKVMKENDEMEHGLLL